MFGAILIILILPYVEYNRIKSAQFKPSYKFIVFLFLSNFIVLGFIGGLHPTETVATVGGIATIFFFLTILILIPSISFIENLLGYISNNRKKI